MWSMGSLEERSVMERWSPSKTGQRRAVVHTVGCRLNQSESLLLADQLRAAGYEVGESPEDGADLAIINTCTVTRLADAKCRQVIRQTIRRNPRAFVAVVGCYSQIGAQVIADIPGVDLIVGNQEKLSVLDYVGEGKNERPVIVRERIAKDDFSIRFVGELPYNERANLKVQDGCDFMCSFCIIPFARGRARSRDLENLVEEGRAMVARGIREIVLTGVNIGSFRSGQADILEVVDRLDRLRAEGLWRLRISSIEPTTVPLELIDRMADAGHALVPHLHLPLQSGCDRILFEMRRRYTKQEYVDFVARVFERCPGLCLGTDIMVGFPGETEEEFEQSCRFFLEQPFAYAHIFPYSEREGTQVMKRQGVNFVEVPERQRRAARLRRLSANKLYDFMEAHIGQTVEVLFENPREGRWPGYTANYIRVLVDSPLELRNRLGQVRLERITADFMEGSLVEAAG